MITCLLIAEQYWYFTLGIAFYILISQYLIVAAELMEVMVIQRELCAAVMLKVKAFFSDMLCHRNKWLNTGHSKRLKSYSMGMLRAFIAWKTPHWVILLAILIQTLIYNMFIDSILDTRKV